MELQPNKISNSVALTLPLCFLNMKEVISITGKSRSTINRWVKKGSFPKPTQLGKNSKAWPVEVISAWREEMITQSTNIVRG